MKIHRIGWSRILVSLLTVQMIALVPSASAADSAQEQVKALTQRYNQVEEQLLRSVHYRKKEGSEPETTVRQAWFDGAGDLLKVATERAGVAGRELIEYFPFGNDDAPEKFTIFVLRRRESPLLDGATRVEEERAYFGWNESSSLVKLRELKKAAEFKAGEALEMEHVPNVIRGAMKGAPELNEKEASKRDAELRDGPGKIARELRAAGALEHEPGAENKGDSDKYRVIRGSASPDGRYAIALGFGLNEEVNWDALKEEPDMMGATGYRAAENPDETSPMVNYLVDLGSRRVLGETGSQYFGTRQSYNHRKCFVRWSPDSTTYVQLTVEKWGYVDCRAGRIAAGPKLAGTIDLAKPAVEAAFAFLRKQKRAKDTDKGSVKIYLEDVANDGVIELQLVSIEPTVPRRGELYYSLDERLRVQSTGSGVSARVIDVRHAKNEP